MKKSNPGRKPEAFHVYYPDHSTRQRRQWKPRGLSGAFNQNLDYPSRMAAQRMFYRKIKKAQETASRVAGQAVTPDFQAAVKPQLGPCYTTYPAALAVYAAIGQTVFLEFRARTRGNILSNNLEQYLANPVEADRVEVDPGTYSQVAKNVTHWIHARLLLEDLSRVPSLQSVELYRLFCSSQENLRFYSLPEIIRAAILYGDVFPDWDAFDLHPITKASLRDITNTSAPFFRRLSVLESSKFVEMGCLWVKAVTKTLAKYLPSPQDIREHQPARPGERAPASGGSSQKEQGFSQPARQPTNHDRIQPLNAPQAPLLQEPTTARDYAESVMKEEYTDEGTPRKQEGLSSKPDPVREVISNFSKAVESAGNQGESWEDVRSDIVENAMRRDPFNASPIEGNPVEGAEVTVNLGDLEMVGEIFDEPVELSDDVMACEKLREEAQPLTHALRKNLYPNIQQDVFVEHFTTSGSLDPKRLALADFASTIFRRFRNRELADLRGAPVLGIACDGSGSLNSSQMNMLKLLCTSYLESTAVSDIQVLAALYTSGRTLRGGSGPIVRWIYHPLKTYASSRREAIRAVTSLPNSGYGVQADALSLAYILESAKKIARQNMVYLVVISDTQWNRSFQTPQSGYDEVRSFFENVYAEGEGKVNTTLVALGVSEKTGLEDLVDSVIPVTKHELMDSRTVARKVGMHVAACLRKAHRLVNDR